MAQYTNGYGVDIDLDIARRNLTGMEKAHEQNARNAYDAMIEREHAQGLCDVNGRWIKNGNHN